MSTQQYLIRISAMCTSKEADLVATYSCVLDEDKLKAFSLELAGELAIKSILDAKILKLNPRPMTDDEIEAWRKENT